MLHARIAALLASSRMIVCVGPGGVGKTSVSAALAIAAAREGRRVFVLTIDPARRLADALGVSLGDQRATIEVPGAKGSLHAAMLETAESWDAIVTRIADDPGPLLSNRIYRAFSRTLARSHAYVAMERLHEALEERDGEGRPRFDLVVLDTPPTRSALEILDAPERLRRFADSRVVNALVPRSDGIFRPVGSAIGRVMRWVMGEGLAHELVVFLASFVPLREGFARRAAAIDATLRGEATAFVLVAAPASAQLGDADRLARELLERGFALEAVIMNRAWRRRAPGTPAPALEWELEDIEALLPAGSEVDASAIAGALRSIRTRVLAEDARSEASIDAFMAGAPGASWCLALRQLSEEPTSTQALLELLESAVAPPLE